MGPFLGNRIAPALGGGENLDAGNPAATRVNQHDQFRSHAVHFNVLKGFEPNLGAPGSELSSYGEALLPGLRPWKQELVLEPFVLYARFSSSAHLSSATKL